MNVDDDGEMVVEHGLDGAIELGHEGRLLAGALPLDQWVGIDADPAVVEAHARDQRDVVWCAECAQALRRVVVRLGKPHGCVNAVLQMLRSGEGDVVLCCGGDGR
jgi:hypothetical protein